jgi:hypothetical protein
VAFGVRHHAKRTNSGLNVEASGGEDIVTATARARLIVGNRRSVHHRLQSLSRSTKEKPGVRWTCSLAAASASPAPASSCPGSAGRTTGSKARALASLLWIGLFRIRPLAGSESGGRCRLRLRYRCACTIRPGNSQRCSLTAGPSRARTRASGTERTQEADGWPTACTSMRWTMAARESAGSWF